MNYSIGDVEDLTGVKAHVLRYWEEVVPAFSPSKDLNGRRSYTQHDIELIFRIKYLITEKKYTAEGAGQQILDEAQILQENGEVIRLIRKTRQELLDLLLAIKK